MSTYEKRYVSGVCLAASVSECMYRSGHLSPAGDPIRRAIGVCLQTAGLRLFVLVSDGAS